MVEYDFKIPAFEEPTSQETSMGGASLKVTKNRGTNIKGVDSFMLISVISDNTSSQLETFHW